jgi:cytochrome c oxidase subunit II
MAYTMPAGVRRRALVLVLASAAALALEGSAAAGNGGLAPPSGASPNAEGISDLYLVLLAITGVAFVAIEGVLLVFVVRYRRRGHTRDPAQIETSGRTQLAFTVVPAVVVAGIVAAVFVKLPGIADAPAADAAGETRIVVEAHQFYWLFRYPNKAVTVNRMVAPADTVVHVEVMAPENDVAHSWWVPELGGKIDAIPGRTNETWFKASVGSYDARCAELCGLQHAVMTAVVDVVPHAEYVRFLEQGVDQADLGGQQFAGVCLACHRLDKAFIGPALAGQAALADRDALERLLRNGIRRMPAVGSTWTDAQIDALYGYTKGLKPSGGQG